MTLSRRQSWGILFVVAIVSLVWSCLSHRFEPTVETDSSSYTAFDWSSPKSILSNQRTFGYPLFYVLVNAVSRDPHAVPFMHWLALMLSAIAVHEGLTAAGYRQYTAVWASATLMFGRAFMDLGHSITADSLACSLSIAAAGCFLGSVGTNSCRWSWWGLVVLTFFAYQTRPAYLFLIPLWPVLSLFLDRLVLRRSCPWKDSLRRLGTYAAVTALPFMAFCTLRYAVVGHWGLVSFGGYNLIGVVGQFLDQPSVEAMPGELRPLAQTILERSKQLNDAQPPSSFLAMETMYNPTIWEVFVPTVKEAHGDDPLAINRVLSQLSGELLRQHPRQYVRWLVWNGVHAVRQIVMLTLTDNGTRLLMAILFLVHLLSLWRGPSERNADSDVGPDRAGDGHPAANRFLELHLIFWTAVGFAAAKGLLVVLVEPANDRYMSGAMPLLPAAIAVFAMYFVAVPSSVATSPSKS